MVLWITCGDIFVDFWSQLRTLHKFFCWHQFLRTCCVVFCDTGFSRAIQVLSDFEYVV